ncbi:MAG: CvfD/Ygs/GSP13 family RNA-binding post-transcriptional regulator [Streptococcaceae bacterium]|jgi:general stress protein 13|nr:CvfD/Ygs/GSP13 family RNA-binding post-transcriptional regulator [Streptococcaceae bacterium]
MVKIGDIVTGTITGIQPYGAFVQIDSQTQGLIHVSEIKAGFVKAIDELFSINQQVTVQIIDIDGYSGKISLSIRTLGHPAKIQPKTWKRYFTNKNRHIGFASLKRAMPGWIKEDLVYLNRLAETEKGSSTHD